MDIFSDRTVRIRVLMKMKAAAFIFSSMRFRAKETAKRAPGAPAFLRTLPIGVGRAIFIAF